MNDKIITKNVMLTTNAMVRVYSVLNVLLDSQSLKAHFSLERH